VDTPEAANAGKWCVIFDRMEAGTTTATAPRRRHTGRWLALGLVGLFLALLVYGVATKGTDDRIDRALAQGRAPAAPAFRLEVLERGSLPGGAAGRRVAGTLADGRLDLAELRGTPVVLNLWASWCSPCRAESAVLEQGWQRWRGRGVAYLGMDIQDLRGDARRFLREQGLTYPSVRDAGRGTANRYGATGIPETFFIDRRGDVVGHVIGAVDARQLAAGSRAALSGTVIGRTAGGASFDVR
jgi:cytochrome c biogenesis protein CcmG/thiol:disulfide interchange protein DsbE